MNRIFALLVMFSVTAWGANPGFQDFNGNQFGVNGNKVRLKSGVIVTNPVIGSGTLTGKITSGSATNDFGVRVAYLDDVVAGSATNVINVAAGTNIVVVTNSPTLLTISAREAVTNAYITNLYAGDTFISNAFITNLFSGNTYVTNLITTNLFSSNAFFTNVFATNAYITNVFSTTQITSNIYATNLITTNLYANTTYVSNAYITNLYVTGITGLTNNTSLAGVVVGSGIGSNLTAYARLDATTNHFTGDAGWDGQIGVGSATSGSLDVLATIHSIHTNAIAAWDSNGLLKTNSNLLSPTNTSVVGQVLHASSTSGDSKWDYVNQTLTNGNPVVPDFALPVNYFQTNAAFLFLAPANVDTTKTKIQVTDVIVTNSTAAAILATFPASVHATGTPYTTNVTVFHWRQYAQQWTNCVCEPVW